MLWIVGLLACVGIASPGIATADESQAADPAETALLGPFDDFGGPMSPGPEGALWFTNGKQLGKIDAAGKLSELALSSSIGSVRDITAGPHGDLWAASRSEVDRITTTGEVTRFRLPPEVGEVGSIAAAMDGTLWVTTWAPQYRKERTYGKAYVVRMLPDGHTTSFALPGRARERDRAPGSIVAGPGGEIWFTDPAFGRFGRLTPAGKLTEFHNRLRPEALTPDGAGELWFVGTYGVGTIAADGKVRELRVGSFYGSEIGGGYDAVSGPEGDLWFIGGATRVMRMTPTGHLDQVRGAGAPAASHIALGPGGTIWVSTNSNAIKGVVDAPLLRYQSGFPGIEAEATVAQVKGGWAQVPLSCGGSPSDCSGEVTMSFGRKRKMRSPYEVAAESDGTATVALPQRERHLLARSGFLRVSVFVTVDGGSQGFTQLVLRAPRLPAPRPGHPLLLPLPENIEPRGWVRASDGTIWAGGSVGRFTRITPAGHVSTVVVPGLSAEPVPIGFDARGRLWFNEYHYEDALSVIGRFSPGGKLEQVHLPPGPAPTYEAAIGPAGEIWIPRSDYSHSAEIDRIGPGVRIRRFPIGTEPGALTVDGHGGIWLSEAGPLIVHIGANGRRHVFPVPHKGFVGAMALGPSGSVWFTHWSRRGLPCAIGHLSADGNVVEYPVRHVGEVTWISIERNGDLSFGTEFPSGEGRMAPSGKLISLRRHRQARGSHARTVAIAGEGSG